MCVVVVCVGVVGWETYGLSSACFVLIVKIENNLSPKLDVVLLSMHDFVVLHFDVKRSSTLSL